MCWGGVWWKRVEEERRMSRSRVSGIEGGSSGRVQRSIGLPVPRGGTVSARGFVQTDGFHHGGQVS